MILRIPELYQKLTEIKGREQINSMISNKFPSKEGISKDLILNLQQTIVANTEDELFSIML